MTSMHHPLDDAKVGDIFIYLGNYGDPPQALKVERLTPTQAIVGSRRFSRKWGEEIGGPGALRVPTPALLAQVGRGAAHRQVRHMADRILRTLNDRRWDGIDARPAVEHLEAALAALEGE